MGFPCRRPEERAQARCCWGNARPATLSPLSCLVTCRHLQQPDLQKSFVGAHPEQPPQPCEGELPVSLFVAKDSRTQLELRPFSQAPEDRGRRPLSQVAPTELVLDLLSKTPRGLECLEDFLLCTARAHAEPIPTGGQWAQLTQGLN